jgi:hypothetical protein
MRELPKYNCSLLVRVDFSDDAAWRQLLTDIEHETEEGFRAYVEPIDDPEFDGADWLAIKAAVPDNDEGASVLFVADTATLATDDHPVLVVDLFSDAPPFRCDAANLWSVESNLNISNMDWDEFAELAGPDGVFRGFPRTEEDR